MKALATVILMTVILPLSSFAQVVPGKSELSEPPFWMMSYDEFVDLQIHQKDFYLRNVLPELTKLSAFKKFSAQKLDDAAAASKDWEALMTEVSVSCADKSLIKDCKALAEVREKAFDLEANQKDENRKALEAEKEAKKPAKKK